MNFYNDEENEKKAGAPVLPRAASPFKKTSAFGKTPLFSRAAGGIMDRLKNLSRKDMALVGLGLSVLTMVPVAEYMMSQPSPDNVLEGGWGGKEKLGNMPYEPGINGLSQGSSDGSGEVITPLSSRDPMSLILGSQPTQPAVTAPVYTPPASSMRDAMRDAGREAFSAASKSAGAPTVIPKMAAGLRGMSSFFGGGESSRTQGSLGGGKIINDARSASSKAAKRSMVGPVAIAGYKGVASTPNSASKGAFEKLRAAADKSAGNFSGGSAMNSLDKAAADALEIGKGAGGMGAGGDSDKTGKTSGNSVKGYEHNRSGESLAEMAAKQRQQKALEWEFFKKYEIKKQIINAIVGAVSGVLGDFVKGNMTSALGMDPPPAAKCWQPILQDPATIARITKENLGNPEGYANAMCGALGSVQLITTVGKESAQGFQTTCLCGRGKTADYPKGAVAVPGAGPGPGGPGYVPGGPGAPAVDPGTPGGVVIDPQTFSEYDAVLKGMVEKTAEVQAKPETAKDGVAAIAEGFPKLSRIVTSNYAVRLRSLSEATAGAFSAYSAKVISAQSAHTALKPDYDALIVKLDSLPATIRTGSAGPGAISDVRGTNVENIASNKDTQKLADIEALITEWKATAGKTYTDSAAIIQLEARRVRVYKDQVDKLQEGVRKIGEKQAGIDAAVSGIAETDPAKKITALTGQDVAAAATPGTDTAAPAPAPAPAPAANKDASAAPIETAAQLRGVVLSWTPTYELDSKAVSGKETTDWEAWRADSSKELGLADNLLLSQMRNKELREVIAAGLAAATAAEANFGYVKTQMESLKNQLITMGVPPGYFGGGNTAGNTPPPAGNTPPPAGNTPPPAGNTPPPAGNTPPPAGNTPPPPPQVDPNAASEGEVSAAKANLAILSSVHRYGVGVNNGAVNCSNTQSSQISLAFDTANAMLKGGLTKNEVTAIERKVEHACNILEKCNPRGADTAGCN
ncbi:MAG: hypothetical protein A2X31_03385 [Elusimicrobia bacterium GWB2_63_22]|nr:MAG: hypothetical protein A2X31_03385 [Elusimicrobia bacterium GWB2_63_22]